MLSERLASARALSLLPALGLHKRAGVAELWRGENRRVAGSLRLPCSRRGRLGSAVDVPFTVSVAPRQHGDGGGDLGQLNLRGRVGTEWQAPECRDEALRLQAEAMAATQQVHVTGVAMCSEVCREPPRTG